MPKKKKKSKSHKSLKDQAAAAFPEAEKRAAELMEKRKGKAHYTHFHSEKPYGRKLEAVLKDESKDYNRESILDEKDLSLLDNKSMVRKYKGNDDERSWNEEDNTNKRTGAMQGGRSTPSVRELLSSRTGVNDTEIFKKYQKPYLKYKESRVMFLHLSCGLKFPEIAVNMKMNPPALRKLWERTKKKVFEKERDKVNQYNLLNELKNKGVLSHPFIGGERERITLKAKQMPGGGRVILHNHLE